ncbi:MAG: DUF262 domain-containing protein [Butyrivibrio sp.]|nr:DUF262 domain-containing protein [Butyrivibrio sp.]
MSEQVTSSEQTSNISPFTPETLSKNGELIFSIPLYQRIFTWGDKEIEQLLYDLEQTFSNGKNPYYLGMLTLKYNGETSSYDVIDGQQRLTILMLLGAVLSKEDDEWKDFLSVDEGRTRLNLPSREQDNKFLKDVINDYEKVLPRTTDNEGEKNQNSEDCKQKNQQLLDYNPNLLTALEIITSYQVKEGNESKLLVEKEGFSEFVFKKLRFFATYLPDYYTPGNLNKYFDRMNDSGKNLEPHEILLGEYLKVLDIERKEKIAITELWKKATDLSNPMISADEFKKNFKGLKEIVNDNQANNGEEYFVVFSKYLKIDVPIAESQGDKLTLTVKDLANMVMDEDEDFKNITYGYSQSLLTINELLLLCLYKTLEKKGIKTPSFFNTSKIISTFQDNLSWTDENDNAKNILLFMKTFFCSRLLLDLFFLRRDQSGRYMPPLFFAPKEKDEPIVDELATLMRYEEFLYAVEDSGSNYRWFMPMLDIFEKCVTNANDLNNKISEVIKDRDKDQLNNKPLDKNELIFSRIQRYWFWRLDLALWCDRNNRFVFNEEFLKVANNYHFSRNRSIEHVAPQKPKSGSDITINDNVLHSFGNLCMISAGLNSSLKNESFEVKKAHVESYLNGSVGGTIESLKLLAIYYYCKKEGTTWNDVAITNHGEEMFKLLEIELKKTESQN